MDRKAANTIQLCLADEVIYNVMDEETITGLWLRLETLYMTKSLSNKLYLKKQLCGLRMKEGTTKLTLENCEPDGWFKLEVGLPWYIPWFQEKLELILSPRIVSWGLGIIPRMLKINIDLFLILH